MESYINGGKGTIHIDDGGFGNTPLLFTHSFAGSIRQWRHQLDHFRKSRRAIAFDFRGHGRSSPSSDNDYSVEALSSDIEAVADELKLEKFFLIGHSMGGAAAIAYAGKYPNRLAGIVVCGTPGRTDSQKSKPIVDAIEADYDRVMEDYMQKLLTKHSPGVDREVMNDFGVISKDHSIKIIRSLFDFNPLPYLNRYKGPMLIIHTDAEDQPDSLHNQLPQLPSGIIAGTSHWMQMDNPDEFNAMIEEFISKNSQHSGSDKTAGKKSES
jgi:pimeloyl-ACP methyl ester carboxylesterase